MPWLALVRRMLVALVALALLPSVAAAWSAARPVPVANQLLGVKITFEGHGSYTRTLNDSCQTGYLTYQFGAFKTDANFSWTTLYDPIHFSQAQLKAVGPINVGDASSDDRDVSGSWTYVDPCQTLGGQLTDIEDVGGPSQAGTFVYAKLEDNAVLFQVDPMEHLGEPNRDNWGHFDGGHVATSSRFGPEGPGSVNITSSLVATVKVPITKLRALNVGRGGKIVIPLEGPIAPWTFAHCEDGCTDDVTWSGSITVEPACTPNQRTGPGYEEMKPAMKSALNRLYAKLQRAKACYRFTVGYRDQSYQDKLRKRWHDIADDRGANDNRSEAQVCEALKGAGFAQCPAGHEGNGKAKGGPALVSRHTAGQAADITVLWPPNYERNVQRYQKMADAAGLCGPPATDPVHVELPYAKGSGPHKDKVRCWFPPGPAPGHG